MTNNEQNESLRNLTVEGSSNLEPLLAQSTRLQVQPDRASCFITSVAMVIEVPVDQLIEEVNEFQGINHKYVLHPGRDGSMKYRGHHMQDIVEPLIKRGWAIMQLFCKVPITHMYPKGCPLCGGKGKFRGQWHEYNLPMSLCKYGVLHYEGHACAWINGKVYNPVGRIEEFHTTKLLGFHPMFRINNNEELLNG